MKTHLQDGIYYNEPGTGNSFQLLFLKADITSTPSEIASVLTELWRMFMNLKKGIVKDLIAVNEKHRYPGNLTVLIGYGPQIFSLKNLRRNLPIDLSNNVSFDPPDPMGGGSIIQGSKIYYGKDIKNNHADSQHIIIQFIADNEFITSRAIVEAWRVLSTNYNSDGRNVLLITKIYSGFQRDDGRNWLGFHDGVSNIERNERLQDISIDDISNTEDIWIMNGTYLGFIRTEFNLKNWWKINASDQSIVIGREKITGCPLIGVDKNNNPVKDRNCPIPGTFEVIEPGNELYRTHPEFGNQTYLPVGVSDKILEDSHVGRATSRLIENKKMSGYKIFRQGFEYLEPLDVYPGFRAGLNFISFQKSPKTLFNILKKGFGPKKMTRVNDNLPLLEDFISVRDIGVFLVPPTDENEPFPGASIFIDNHNSRSTLFARRIL